MSKEITMADGTVSSEPGGESAGSSTGPVAKSEAAQSRQFTEAEVLANAALPEDDRVKKAEEELRIKLDKKKEEGLLKAHSEAANEPGAGVYNYKVGQLLRKARILQEAGFDPEQRQILFEAGLVGVRPSTKWATFIPDHYVAEPALKGLADELLEIGLGELADETVFTEYLKRLDGLVERGAVTDKGLEMKLRKELIKFRLEALNPPKSDHPLLSSYDRQRIEQEAIQAGGTLFSLAKAYFEHYCSLRRSDYNTDPALQAELDERRLETRRDIILFKDELENNPLNDPMGKKILKHVREAALKFLISVRLARPQEGYGGVDRGTLLRNGRSKGFYEELVFDDSLELKELERKYGGLARYIFSGVVQEIDKDAGGRQETPLNPLAADEYRRIKVLREIARLKEKKFTEEPSHWGGGRIYHLLWPESARDMGESIRDWVKDRISEIGDRDVGIINDLLGEIRKRAAELLETCRIRLNNDEWLSGDNEITETNPEFRRAIYNAEGITDVFGNEAVRLKGNTEYGPQLKERFGSPFIPHHDEIYMGNPSTALILHLLSKKGINPNSPGKHDWSTYWMGSDYDVEKDDEGEIRNYREEIQEEIIEFAATHSLFLSDSSTRGRGLYKDSSGVDVLGKDGRPIGAFAYREGGNPEKRDLRYSFKDNIETLLLDPGDLIRQEIINKGGGAEALARHDIRVKFFRDTKAGLDAKEGLGGLTAEQRKTQIRLRIIQKMKQKTNGLNYMVIRSKDDLVALTEAQRAGDVDKFDKILWDWVRDYNQSRIDYRLRKWYPSGWERVRWGIDRPTQVLDRKLSEEEFEAMYDPVDIFKPKPYDITFDIKQSKEDARFGFQVARKYQSFHMQDTMLGGTRTRLIDPDTGEYVGKLPDDETNKLLGLIKVDALGNIMLGPDGKSIAVDPRRKLVRIFDVIQARLEAAIKEEAAELEVFKAEKAAAVANRNAAIASRNPAAIAAATAVLEEKTKAQMDAMRNAQFLATHALKAIGVVDGKLPVWSYNFLDRATIKSFTEALAAYGLDVDVGVEMSHDRKKEFYEYLERGRRALHSEYRRAAEEFMEGKYPVFQHDADGKVKIDAEGKPIPAISRIPFVSNVDDAAPLADRSPLTERFRINNPGAIRENSQITQAEYELSTTGGVTVHELNYIMGNLGYYPMLVWLGVTNIRELHGYIKRGNEVEYHQQAFFDVKDWPCNAKAEAAAYNARKALTGGTIEYRGSKTYTPGFLLDPFYGSVFINTILREWYHSQKLKSRGMHDTDKYLGYMNAWRARGGKLEEKDMKIMGAYRQNTYKDFEGMHIPMNEQLYLKMYDVIKYFIWYLEATKEVEQNRSTGHATRNWYEHNTERWYAFRREIRRAGTDPSRFIRRHKFSPEIASEISLRMMEQVLEEADYQILTGVERQNHANEGARILAKALNESERRVGWAIPDEKKWASLRPEVREALETIRLRNLLIFMREEGYPLLNANGEPIDANGRVMKGADGKVVDLDQARKVLGYEMPPMIRYEKAEKEPEKYLNLLRGNGYRE